MGRRIIGLIWWVLVIVGALLVIGLCWRIYVVGGVAY